MATPHLYAIDAGGNLLWYTHIGREDGTFRWIGPQTVGTGWGGFERVFSGGDGILYAIEKAVPQRLRLDGTNVPASGGRLLWYRHVGHDDGTFRWEGPNPVGVGWSGFEHVFAAGDGVIYIVEPAVEGTVQATGGSTPTVPGNLRWYRHLGWRDGTFRWDGPRQVGVGWSGFERVWSGGDDVIYLIEKKVEGGMPLAGHAIPPSGGHLRWYRHLGREDGSFRWLGPNVVGNGWSGFEHVCSGDDGVIYLIEPYVPPPALRTVAPPPDPGGHLRWYRHVGRGDGSFRWQGPNIVGNRWNGMQAFFSAHERGVVRASGRFCDFMDTANSPQVGPKSYLVKPRGRAFPLRWSLSGTANGITPQQMQSTLAAAFALWTQAVPALVFQQVASGGDLVISMTTGLGPINPVTGVGILAQTARDGSTLVFNVDPSVVFVPSGAGGTSLLSVAAHEIGHAIGLLHSSNAANLMAPLANGLETLAIEDREALAALYGWAPQAPVPGIGSSASPALCACGGTLVMAWRGIGSDNGIWSARTTDGVNWTPQQRIPGTGSTDGPTLAWDGTWLWLAIRGVGGDDKLYWATSGDFGASWSPVRPIGGTGSAVAPSITSANGGPLLVWRGVPGDEALYYTAWSGGGWGGQQRIPNTGSSDRPSVALFDGVPRAVWRGISGDDSLWTASFIGQAWTPQQQLSWVMTGNGTAGTIGFGVPGAAVGPTIAGAGGRLLMAWQGVVGDNSIYFTQATTAVGGAPGIEWSSQAIVGGTGTSARPAVAMFAGLPFMAWLGAGQDHTVYTSRQRR